MIHRLLISIVFGLALWPVCLRASPLTPETAHHQLQLRLIPDQGSLEATDTIKLPPTSQREILLGLAPSMQLASVELNGSQANYSFRGGRLRIKVPANIAKSGFELSLGYSGHFSDQPPAEPAHAEDPSYGVEASISAAGVFLGGGSGWYADWQQGQETFRLEVITPSGFEAVTSGRRVERRQSADLTISVWETASPLPSLSLAAGPYQVSEGSAGSIPVYTYFSMANQHLAQTYLQASARYLALYQELFGDYPFEKFAVVENFFPTGYGFPSWTLLGSSVVRLPFIVETSLGHEIAHSWWGTGVRVNYSGGNWAEGLTSYVADYFYQEQQGAEQAREYRLKVLRDYAALVSGKNELALKNFVSRDSKPSQAIGYGKAAMVFHMARKQVGEDRFWHGLRKLAQTSMFQSIGWQDFARAFNGQDMESFFEEWIEKKGAPILELRKVKASQRSGMWHVTGEVSQQGPGYRLEIPLRLETTDGPVEQTIFSDGGPTRFEIIAAGNPMRLQLDPEVNLFRRLDASELPPTVNGLRGAKSLLVVVSNNLDDQTSSRAQTLLVALRQYRAELIDETRLSQQQLQHRDLLYLGLPENGALLPKLPSAIGDLDGQRLVLNGEAFEGQALSWFLALPHPRNSQRTAALFRPGPQAQVEKVARKIPHYGKYSYLVFDGETNRVKGTWPVAESPTVWTFSSPEEKQ